MSNTTLDSEASKATRPAERASRPMPPPPPPAARRKRTTRSTQQSVEPGTEPTILHNGAPSIAPPPPAPPRPPPTPPQAAERATIPQLVPTDDDAAVVLEPPEGTRYPLDEQALVGAMRAELGRKPEPARAARLHYELAVFYERTDLKPARAAEHYLKACKLNRDHLASLQGARRSLITLGKHAEALPLFDAELKLCTTPAQRAQLLFEKGRMLQLQLSRASDALQAYRQGMQLDPRHVDLLRAAAQVERASKRWDELDRTLERLSVAIEHDPSARAAVVAERARLADVRAGDPKRASELYLTALELDPDVSGGAEALKRIGHAEHQLQHLLTVLEQEAARSEDPRVSAAAYARMADLLAEELGDLEKATAAVEAASQQQPEDRAFLLRLCALYAQSGRVDAQLDVLERLRELTEEPSERAALSTRMADLAERELGDGARASGHLLSALQDDPTHRPAMQALAALYSRRSDYRGLLALYGRELETLHDDRLKAECLVRIAALWETGPHDLDQAAHHYKEALGYWPGHDGALRALDRLLPALGQHRELVHAYERVIDHIDGDEHAIAYLMRIGAMYEDRLDEPDGAVAAYERVLRLSPDHLGALHALQRAAILANEFDKALHALEHEADLTSPSRHAAELRYRAAELLSERLGNTKAAIAMLRDVLDQDPGNGAAAARLDALYRRERKWDDLLSLLDLRDSPKDPASRRAERAFEMGQLCERQLGRVDDAVAHYQRALELYPDHPTAFEALTQAFRDNAMWSDLVAALEQRARMRQRPIDSARLSCEAGRVYEQNLKDPSRAAAAYDAALAAAPGHRPAIDARARLLWAQGDARRLRKALHEEAAQSGDHRLSLEALHRAAIVETELLDDAKTALGTYEELLLQAPQHLPALRDVESIHAAAGNDRGLSEVYAAQAAVVEDPRLKASTLRDLARCAGDAQAAISAYRSLLQLIPDDTEALHALLDYAREQDDKRSMVALYGRLAEASSDRSLAAKYHLAIATLIEESDPAQALAAYRSALSLDPENLAAVRGLSRSAQALCLPDALSEAARREARITKDIPLSVELLLQAAELRDRRGDLETAAADAQRALEHDPNHGRAAELLQTILLKSGELVQLGELLSRAAERTSVEQRKAELYTDVARIRAEHLQDLPSAVSAAQRALAACPGHVTALNLLAVFFEAMEKWDEAADAYDRCAEAAKTPAERAQAQLSLALIAVEHLRDHDRAQKSLRVVLAIDSENRRALSLQARIYAAAGRHKDALALSEKLVESAQGDVERASALLALARAQEQMGHEDEAEQARFDALALQGPDSEAERIYFEYLERPPASWERLIESLTQHLRRQREHGSPGGTTVCAIARAQVQGLQDRASAITTLQQGSRLYPDDLAVWIEYAVQLVENNQPDPAIAIIRAQLASHPDHPELWQALSDAHQAGGRPAEAISSALPLLVLDVADGEQRVMLQTRQARPAAEVPALLSDSLVRELDSSGALLSPATALAQTLWPIVAKIRPVDLSRFGVSRRDRVPEDSKHTLRLAVDRIARMLGTPDCDVYVHDGEEAHVTVGLGEPPVLLVPHGVSELSQSRLVFALASRIFGLRFELSLVDALSPRDVAIVLAAAVRRQHPNYGADLASEEELDETSRVLSKAVPWLSRKRVDDAASGLAGAGPLDLEQWCEDVQMVAARAALLLCDDLPGALDVLRTARGMEPLVDPVSRDLLQLWASEIAVRYRQRVLAA